MPKRNGIPGVAEVDLPWTKLHQLGPEGVTTDELLAIILRTGYGNQNVLESASQILSKYPPDALVGLSMNDLRKIKGFGQAKAELLMAACEFCRRALKIGLGIMPSISRPADAVPLVADLKDCKKEHFVALYLNARNQLIHRENVSVGSLNASLVHPREVFAPAVGTATACMILIHNHPSGDPAPSREDIELTRRMVSAGEIMGIEVLDHIIIASDRFLSMKEANLF